MRKSLKEFKKRALARPEVRREYDRLSDEFAILNGDLADKAFLSRKRIGSGLRRRT